MADTVEQNDRSEASETGGSWSSRIEPWTRIAAAVAVPLTIAILGAQINATLVDQSLKKDYVALAISVLMQPRETVSPRLRDWAATLLAENSPTEVDPQTMAELIAGQVGTPQAQSRGAGFGAVRFGDPFGGAIVGEAIVGKAVIGPDAERVTVLADIGVSVDLRIYVDGYLLEFADGRSTFWVTRGDEHNLYVSAAGPEGSAYSVVISEPASVPLEITGTLDGSRADHVERFTIPE